MKRLITLLIVFQLSTLLGNGLKVGFDTIGKHKATDMELDDYSLGNMNNDAENGFSIAFQSMPNFNEKLSFGFGVEYMLIRDVKNNGGGIKFYGNGELSILNSEFRNNVSARGGGAIGVSGYQDIIGEIRNVNFIGNRKNQSLNLA